MKKSAAISDIYTVEWHDQTLAQMYTHVSVHRCIHTPRVWATLNNFQKEMTGIVVKADQIFLKHIFSDIFRFPWRLCFHIVVLHLPVFSDQMIASDVPLSVMTSCHAGNTGNFPPRLCTEPTPPLPFWCVFVSHRLTITLRACTDVKR